MITIDPPSSAHTENPAPSKPALMRFLNRVRTTIGLEGNVDVLLTSDAELKRLNRTFRRKNKPTDVLSFPAASQPGLPPAHQHAGDLAISLDTAARQAAHFHHPLETELRILLLHGLLHLSGLDHETDGGEMATQESELRTRFRLPNSLISRTLHAALAGVAPKQPRPSKSPRKLVILTEAKRRGRTRFSTQTAPTSLSATNASSPQKRGSK